LISRNICIDISINTEKSTLYARPEGAASSMDGFFCTLTVFVMGRSGFVGNEKRRHPYLVGSRHGVGGKNVPEIFTSRYTCRVTFSAAYSVEIGQRN